MQDSHQKSLTSKYEDIDVWHELGDDFDINIFGVDGRLYYNIYTVVDGQITSEIVSEGFLNDINF